MDILERLRDADKRGVAPPQNWTTVAADEMERLRAALKKANEQAEHFEREWYLRGDAIECAAEVARNACEGWNDALMHEGARMAADAVAALLTPNDQAKGPGGFSPGPANCCAAGGENILKKDLT